MKKIRFTGGAPVRVVITDGPGQCVAPNEAIEVDAKTYATLIERPNWQAASKARGETSTGKE